MLRRADDLVDHIRCGVDVDFPLDAAVLRIAVQHGVPPSSRNLWLHKTLGLLAGMRNLWLRRSPSREAPEPAAACTRRPGGAAGRRTRRSRHAPRRPRAWRPVPA